MASVSTPSYRKYSARTFVRGGMECPHCEAGFAEVSTSCPRCGFDLGYCQQSFPFAAPPLSLLIDPGQLLPAETAQRIGPVYQRVRQQFPQIDFSFCFLRLQAEAKLREFAFWLHNTAPDADERRAWTLLVVTDLTSGQLVLSPGYALEPFLRSEPWEAVLQELAGAIGEEQWDRGLSRFLEESATMLRQAWELATERLECDEEPRSTLPAPNPGHETVQP